MNTSMFHQTRPFASLLIFGVIILLGSGCDFGVDDMDDTESATVSGQVTDDESSTGSADKWEKSPSQESQATVEGAAVTAVAVHADGSTSELNGETTTDASGEFSLVVEGEGASDHIRVYANGSNDFESSVIVNVDGRNSVDASPMTVETHAEADVYLEAKADDGSSSHQNGVTAADVAVYINTETASEIQAGAQSASNIGMTIANAMKAQAEYNNSSEAEVDMEAVAVAKTEAFTQLQSELAAATDAEAKAEAHARFENDYVQIFSDADADVETQARFHQIATALMIEASNRASGRAEIGLRQQAELILSTATAHAIEASFQAQGASQSTLEALAEARTQLVAEIRAAASAEAIIEAKDEYKATVDSRTESRFEISSETRAEAEAEFESALGILRTTIANLNIFISGIAEATANAFADFYLSANTDASASLQANGLAEAEARAAANIIVMLSVMN